jgi:hypothetical protein
VKYREFGPGCCDQRVGTGRQARGHIRSLESLGYKGTIALVAPDTREPTVKAD